MEGQQSHEHGLYLTAFGAQGNFNWDRTRNCPERVLQSPGGGWKSGPGINLGEAGNQGLGIIIGNTGNQELGIILREALERGCCSSGWAGFGECASGAQDRMWGL